MSSNSNTSNQKIQKMPGGRGQGGRGPGGAGFGAPVQKAKNFKISLKRLLSYLKPQIPQLIVIIMLAIISTVFAIAIPKVLATYVTNPLAKAIGSNGAGVVWSNIILFILVCLCLYAISALFSFFSNFISAKLSQKVVYKMRSDVNLKMEKLPVKYFDSTSVGDNISVITNDIETISTTLQQSLTQVITSVITIIGTVTMMLTISGWLTLISLVSLPVFAVITGFIMKKSQSSFVAQQKELGQINGHIEEMFSGQRVVKLYNQEKRLEDEFNVINDKLAKTSSRAQFFSGIIFPVLNFVNNLAYVAIVIVGGILAGRPFPLSLGDIQAFIQYSSSFSQPIMQTAQIANIIQSTVAASERVFALLDQPEDSEVTNPQAYDESAIKGDVQFNNVDFSYVQDKELIKNMNISVKSGESIAIVGPTGAGKTTLVNLLMRFYNLDSGSITIDGQDITNYKRSDVRAAYGMVLQDTWLFNGTIKENIAFGKENATDEEIIDAAQKAHIHHYVTTLPDGYDTVLSEGASNISQGQRQLLTIARAILSDPKILILDEATSSVDTRTEEYIQSALTSMMKGKTSFVIAHRLSTIKNANLILVMNNGTVVEQGNHTMLLEQKGFYYNLYNSQFANG